MEDWKEIEGGNVFVFQQLGDAIEGVIVARRDGQFNNKIYDLQTKDGIKTIFGTAILDDRLAKVKDNQPVRIQYAGEVKTGTGRTAKNFKVWTK